MAHDYDSAGTLVRELTSTAASSPTYPPIFGSEVMIMSNVEQIRNYVVDLIDKLKAWTPKESSSFIETFSNDGKAYLLQWATCDKSKRVANIRIDVNGWWVVSS